MAESQSCARSPRPQPHQSWADITGDSLTSFLEIAGVLAALTWLTADEDQISKCGNPAIAPPSSRQQSPPEIP